MFQRGRAGLLPAPHSETQALAPASQQQRRRASNNSLGEGKAFAKPRNGAAHTYAFYTKPVYFKNQFLSYRWHIAKRNENTAAPPPAAIPMTRLGEAGRVTGGPPARPRPPAASSPAQQEHRGAHLRVDLTGRLCRARTRPAGGPRNGRWPNGLRQRVCKTPETLVPENSAPLPQFP